MTKALKSTFARILLAGTVALFTLGLTAPAGLAALGPQLTPAEKSYAEGRVNHFLSTNFHRGAPGSFDLQWNIHVGQRHGREGHEALVQRYLGGGTPTPADAAVLHQTGKFSMSRNDVKDMVWAALHSNVGTYNWSLQGAPNQRFVVSFHHVAILHNLPAHVRAKLQTKGGLTGISGVPPGGSNVTQDRGLRVVFGLNPALGGGHEAALITYFPVTGAHIQPPAAPVAPARPAPKPAPRPAPKPSPKPAPKPAPAPAPTAGKTQPKPVTFKITTATLSRSKRTLVVRGTTASKTQGTARVTYKVKVGKKVKRVTRTVKVKHGKFSLVTKVSPAVAKSKRRGTVSVAYKNSAKHKTVKRLK